MQVESKETLVRYILGELSQEEREALEQRYFVNDEVWAELQAAETDLIDSYLRNELSVPQRDHFEQYFLASPRRRRRLEFARIQRASSAVLDEERAALEPAKARTYGLALRLGFAVAMIVLMAALVVIAMQNFKLRAALNRMNLEQTTLRQQVAQLQQQVASRVQGQSSAELLSQDLPTISLLLTPGELRGPTPSPVLPLSAVPSNILLLLELREDRFPSYEVSLSTVEGKQIYKLEALKSIQSSAAGPVVAVKLPSKLLPRGDYIAALSGRSQTGKSETIDAFTFTVLR